jgi:alpha-1,2-glucosyltransferase
MVHFNTIVHPFTLADNRHYPFYVFRYFILPPYRKYLLAPIYIVCGWLCVIALGPASSTATARISSDPKPTAQDSHTITFARVDTVHVSFVLVFLVSTALSLVTAPLVEPRYFLIPWLVWRLHVPELLESDTAQSNTPKTGKDTTKIGTNTGLLYNIATTLGSHALTVELLWYMLVNFITGYLFISRPFVWTQEPGKSQRFMW